MSRTIKPRNLQIEKGIPLPFNSEADFDEKVGKMEICDSLTVDSHSDRMCVMTMAYRRYGFKMTSKIEGSLIRIWRVE